MAPPNLPGESTQPASETVLREEDTVNDAPYTAGNTPKGTPGKESAGTFAGSEAAAKKYKRLKWLGLLALILGLIILAFGLVWGLLIPPGLEDKVEDNVLVCSSSSSAYDSFVDPYTETDDNDNPTEVFRLFRVFNLTNTDDVQDGGKPRLQEIGPFVYRQRDRKINVSFEDDGKEVTYQSYSQYYFQSDDSRNCDECDDPSQLQVQTLGLAYLSVLTQAGSEEAFAQGLVAALAGDNLDLSDPLIGAALPTLMTFALELVNCFDSLRADYVGQCATLLQELSAALESGDLVGAFGIVSDAETSAFLSQFRGWNIQRSVKDIAFGYPNFVGGLAATLGSGWTGNYTGDASGGCGTEAVPPVCAEVEAQCGACATTQDAGACSQCSQTYNFCRKCGTAAKLVDLTPLMCESLRQRWIQQLQGQGLSEEEATETASRIAQGTCGQCNADSGFLLCLAPTKGLLTLDQFDYTTFDPAEPQFAPLLNNLEKQATGCDGTKQDIAEMELYMGQPAIAVWAELGGNSSDGESRQNPSPQDIQQFVYPYTSCPFGFSNVSCAQVQGRTGLQVPYAGADMLGLKTDTNNLADEYTIWVEQGINSIQIQAVEDDAEVKGITVKRYSLSPDVLHFDNGRGNQGFGVPVDGVLQVTYDRGLLAWLSQPFFINGDSSLVTDVDLIPYGQSEPVSTEAFQSDDFINEYNTFIEIEPSSGKTFSADKKLMGSISFSSLSNGDGVFTNVLSENVVPELITPIYWGEETGTITDDSADAFKQGRTMGNSALPVLIVGIIVGLALILAGILMLRKAKASRNAVPAVDGTETPAARAV